MASGQSLRTVSGAMEASVVCAVEGRRSAGRTVRIVHFPSAEQLVRDFEAVAALGLGMAFGRSVQQQRSQQPHGVRMASGGCPAADWTQRVAAAASGAADGAGDAGVVRAGGVDVGTDEAMGDGKGGRWDQAMPTVERCTSGCTGRGSSLAGSQS